MIQFILGIILGVLIRDIKFEALKAEERLEKWVKGEKVQFIEPISIQERFHEAKNIDDML